MKANGVFRMVVGILGTLLVMGGVYFLTGCGKDSNDNNRIVAMTELDTFDPVEVMVAAGDTVIWINNDSDNHAAISDPGTAAGGPNSDATYPAGVAPGETYSWSVPSAAASGTKWYYHCRFHGNAGNGSSLGIGMVGVITVE